MSDRMTHEPVDPGGGPDRIESEHLSEFPRGELSRGRGGPGIRRGEREKTTELRSEHPAHLPELTHAQRDHRLLTLGQQVEHLEIVTNAASREHDLPDRAGVVLDHLRDPGEQIRGPTAEIMARDDESGGDVPDLRFMVDRESDLLPQIRTSIPRGLLQIQVGGRVRRGSHRLQERDPVLLVPVPGAAFGFGPDRRDAGCRGAPKEFKHGGQAVGILGDRVKTPLDHPRALGHGVRGPLDRGRDVIRRVDEDGNADQ